MDALLVVLLTGILVAAACALLGSFLMLRKMAMLTDAISHAVLPGIVAGYFLANGPSLIFGFAGAAAAALATVALVEVLKNTGKVGSESAIGIVFPAMFALGAALVSRFYANVHLDTDAVLYGNIEFVGFESLVLGGVNLGPKSLWVMGGLTVLNLLFVWVLFKELKIATFDPGLASSLGFEPRLLHYGLMVMISITTVGAFSAVGSVLVIAFMVVPAATAYLLTDDLRKMIGLAVLAGVLSAAAGFGLALMLDASVAGAMATMAGVLFALTLLFSPLHGLVPRARRLSRQRLQLAIESLVVHLANHENQADEAHESEIDHLRTEMRWEPAWAARIVALAIRRGLITMSGEQLLLTREGREQSRRLINPVLRVRG
jgi:manganese/zinc/iron transport system permease protein